MNSLDSKANKHAHVGFNYHGFTDRSDFGKYGSGIIHTHIFKNWTRIVNLIIQVVICLRVV